MSQVHAAASHERLPWLEDDPPPAAESRLLEIAGWVFAAILLLAGAAYWLTVRTSGRAANESERQAPSTTVVLPEAQVPPTQLPAPASGTGVSTNEQDGSSAQEPTTLVPRSRSDRDRSGRAKTAQLTNGGGARAPARSRPAIGAQAAPGSPVSPGLLAAPPVFHSPQADGRVVQIGAFGSTHQAKLGWTYMVRKYPGVAHLHASVVQTRNSAGRPFYRFEIATSSQAHSEVLCQWMQQIEFSCAVVGLPWKPKGVER